MARAGNRHRPVDHRLRDAKAAAAQPGGHAQAHHHRAAAGLREGDEPHGFPGDRRGRPGVEPARAGGASAAPEQAPLRDGHLAAAASPVLRDRGDPAAGAAVEGQQVDVGGGGAVDAAAAHRHERGAAAGGMQI